MAIVFLRKSKEMEIGFPKDKNKKGSNPRSYGLMLSECYFLGKFEKVVNRISAIKPIKHIKSQIFEEKKGHLNFFGEKFFGLNISFRPKSWAQSLQKLHFSIFYGSGAGLFIQKFL